MGVYLGEVLGARMETPVFVLCAMTAIALPAQTFNTLFIFDSADGARPGAALVQGVDGNLYGTTRAGGAGNSGTVFKVTPSGTLTTLYSFCAQSGCGVGVFPLAELVQATNGDFYGTTSGVLENSPASVARSSACR
jgi:uncharacterized repeat protein (TIGR03803 family)